MKVKLVPCRPFQELSAWRRQLLTPPAPRQACKSFLLLGEKSLKDLRGDVASWEKEDGWETSGEVNVVTLRCLTFKG